MKRVIAIVGPAGAGKSTLASELAHSHGAVRLAIADGVRAATAISYGHEVRKGVEYDTARGVKTGREILQAIGGAIRQYDPHFWLRRIDSQIMLAPEDALIVIDDLRLCEEAEYLRSRHNTFVVLLTASREVRAGRRVLKGESDPTEMEWQLVRPDLVIDTSEKEPDAVLAEVTREVLS